MFFFVFSGTFFASEAFDKGSSLFLNNKPAEAAVYLEQVVRQEPENYQAYMYLGIAYEQMAQYAKAIDIYQKALSLNLGDSYVLLFNIGNNYQKLGNYDEAKRFYKDCLARNPSYVQAYLNSGNSQVRKGDLEAALADYERFVETAPGHARTPEVVKMIAAIRNELVLREEKKIEAEKARIAEEKRQQEEAEQKKSAELRAKEEEARKKAFLDSIFDSLSEAASEQKALSAGSEAVKEVQDNFERED